jgi:hypothetical protein
MTMKPAHYSPISEATAAWLHGIVSFAVVGAVFTLIALPIASGFDGSMIRTIQQQGIVQTIAQGFMFAIAIPLGFMFWAVLLIALSMLQFVVLAVPMAYLSSKGLESDAARGWVFYGLAGIGIGLGPWLAAILFAAKTAFIVQNFPDVKALSIVLIPALLSGLFAGLFLKYQLMKLTETSNANLAQPLT